MSLIPSLLQAVVNLDGEALVMHVGEKPYVISPTGQVDLSARGLSFDAVWGILTQLLPPQSQAALEEFGAAQFELERIPTFEGERFTVVAARGGDDVWVELRRRRASAPAVEAAASLAAPKPGTPRATDSAADRLAAPEPAAASGSVSPEQRLAAPEPGAPAQQVASFEAPAAAAPDAPAIPEPTPAPVKKVEATHQTFTVEHTSYQAEEIEIDLDAAANVEPEPPQIAAAVPELAPPLRAIPASPVAVAVPLQHSDVEDPPETWETIDLAAEAGPAFDSPETIERSAAMTSLDEPPVAVPVPSATYLAETDQVSESHPLSAELRVEPVPEPVDAPPTPVRAFAVDEAPPVATPPLIPAEWMPPTPAVAAAAEAPAPAVTTPPAPTFAWQPPAAPQPQSAAAASAAPVASAPPAAPPPVVAPPPAAASPILSAPPSPAPTAAMPPLVAVPTSAAPIAVPPPAAPAPAQTLAPAGFAPSPVIAPFPTIRPSAPSYSVASGDAPLSQPAVVLPLTRNPIRPEAPPALGEEAISTLDRLLRLAAARGAAALYLSSTARPSLRVDGEMQVVDGPILGPNEVESLLMTLMPERNAEALRTGSATEWIIDLPELGRVRCMSFRDHRGPGGVFRMMPVRAVTAEHLALSREIQALAMEPEGLVIIAGPRSGGKRTLIAALIDLINRGRRDHVITVEREINTVHERVGSFVSQRESRGGLPAMFEVAQAALREDPDVLVLEEVRSTALMNVALDAAAAGQLVVGGFPAHSASDAIDRIIDLYPPEQRRQVQLALAQNLRGVIGQVLLRKSGGGRIAARELLLNTPAVASVLAEGKTSQLPLAIEGGRKHGMAPLNDSLVALVQGGIVSAGEAYRHASDRSGFLALLNRQGFDTSFARLA
jgi:twitching motility protein PilT